MLRNPFDPPAASRPDRGVRFRNPRFAPESLERRLSPSSLGVAPTPAYVTTLRTDEPCPLPPTIPGLPPVVVPPPSGPSGPAFVAG